MTSKPKGQTAAETLTDEDLDAADGGGVTMKPILLSSYQTGGASQAEDPDLIAPAKHHTATASFNPKEISIDKSLLWQKHK